MLRKLSTSFLVFMISSVAYANTASNDLASLLTKMTAMKADFSQVITDKNARQIQKSVGKMAMQRPGKFRWDVKKPSEQLVVTNGAKVWIYDPDLEQVTIKMLTKEVGESPAMLLTNPNVSIEKDYVVKVLPPSSKDLQWFALTPKSQNSMFAKIKIGFDDAKIREMELQDHLGHTTAIAFYNIQMNPSLSKDLFSFKPPTNVDVIDETRRS